MSPASAASTGTRSRPWKREHLADLGLRRNCALGQRTVEDRDLLPGHDAAAADAADAEPADVARVVERAHLELQRRLGDRRRVAGTRARIVSNSGCIDASAGVDWAFATFTSSVAQPFSADA